MRTVISARTEDGRLLDVALDARPEEIAEAMARRNAEDARTRAALARIGVRNGTAYGRR